MFYPNMRVFCPALSNKPFILRFELMYQVYLIHDDIKFRFTTSGHRLHSTYHGDIALDDEYKLIVCNEENALMLEKKYDKQFYTDVDVNVYAVKTTDDSKHQFVWLAIENKELITVEPFNRTVYNRPSISEFKERKIILSTDDRYLRSSMQGSNFRVTCVGRDSINNWSHNHE